MPTRYESGSRDTYYVDSSPKDAARREYFETIDNTIAAIEQRVEQGSINIYTSLVLLLRDAINGKCCLVGDDLAKLYDGDFDAEQLRVQLSLIHGQLSGLKIKTVKDFSTWLINSPSRHYLPQVEKLVRLILTLPATNATSERAFSALKRIKTYLRNSMGQKRLNACLALHLYKDMNTALDNDEIIKQFVAGHSDRKNKISIM